MLREGTSVIGTFQGDYTAREEVMSAVPNCGALLQANCGDLHCLQPCQPLAFVVSKCFTSILCQRTECNRLVVAKASLRVWGWWRSNFDEIESVATVTLVVKALSAENGGSPVDLCAVLYMTT